MLYKWLVKQSSKHPRYGCNLTYRRDMLKISLNKYRVYPFRRHYEYLLALIQFRYYYFFEELKTGIDMLDYQDNNSQQIIFRNGVLIKNVKA